MIENIDYHITDDCNLNCVSCNHFCPLTSGHKTIEQIKADLYLLSKFRDNIRKISIMGGEPTLHPDLKEILYFIRSIFPFNAIFLISNGVVSKTLLDIKEDMIKNHIYLVISEYPFKKDYKEHYQKIFDEYGEWCINNSTPEMLTLMMQTKPLAYRRIATTEEVLNCRMRTCSQLRDGKVYPCNILAGYQDFDNAFKGLHNLQNDNTCYADLNTCTVEDLENTINNATPALCYYCKECKRWSDLNMESVPWSRSTKSIDEWYDTDEHKLSEMFT